MTINKVFISISLLLAFLILGISLALASAATIGGNANGYSCLGDHDNRWKIETGSQATLPDGYTITKVVVKAGQNCIEVYPSNSVTTCYFADVDGNEAEVTKIGGGRSCQDISHLEGLYEEVEVTPTPTPIVTPTPTPEVTPTPTTTPHPQPQLEPVRPSNPSAPQCTDIAPVHTMANFHLLRNGDQAIVKWVPTEGAHAHIYYKLVTSLNWEHSVINATNDGYEVINGLGNRDWTFVGQQVNGCAAGPMSNQVVDGNGHWILFR